MPCYVVGGVVRDILIGRPLADKDIDCTIEGSADIVADILAKKLGGKARHHQTFLTAKVYELPKELGYDEVDLATTRTERYNLSGSLPIVSKANIYEDLKRRDFTINSMAIELSVLLSFLLGQLSIDILKEQIIDPQQGVFDLNNKLLRVIHKNSFLDDPTRIFRLVRYQSRLGFEVESETKKLIFEANNARAINSLTLERVWNEVKKALAEEKIAAVFNLFQYYKLFEQHTELKLLFEGLSQDDFHVYANEVEDEPIESREKILLSLALAKGADSTFTNWPKLGVGKKTLNKMSNDINIIKLGCAKTSSAYLLKHELNSLKVIIDA